MNTDAILWPLIAQVILTTVVWLRMYFSRSNEMKAKRLHPQKLATSRDRDAHLEDTRAADNFRNLFEVPVLFYTVCLVLFVAGAVTTAQLALAWAFVGLRAAHSAIQLTYNKVMHRFLVYLASTLCVLAMWALFIFHIL